tara:strand:+ start:2077 stop:3219 length:1143 start_codon:yes stop_codon:yes gene_type:complete
MSRGEEKVEIIDNNTALTNYIAGAIKYMLFLLVTLRCGTGPAARFSNWYKSIQKDDLSKPPYSTTSTSTSPIGKWDKAIAAEGGSVAAMALKHSMKSQGMRGIPDPKAAMRAKMRRKRPGGEAGPSSKAPPAQKGGGLPSADQHTFPYDLINTNYFGDWVGRQIAWSFATQRKIFNTILKPLGKIFNPRGHFSGGPFKDNLMTYIKVLFAVCIGGWAGFWFIFTLKTCFGWLVTLWGASVFGAFLNQSWGPKFMDWLGGMHGAIFFIFFHWIFAIIPWVIHGGINVAVEAVGIIMLLVFFFRDTMPYCLSEDTKRYWNTLSNKPKYIFFLLMLCWIMAAVVELSGPQIQGGKHPGYIIAVAIPIIFMVVFQLVEWGYLSK